MRKPCLNPSKILHSNYPAFLVLTMKNPIISKLQLISLLQNSKTITQILQIHSQLITTNLITNPFNSSQLLSSLTSPNMKNAELLFTQTRQPNTYMWNTMIKGYVQSSNPEKGFDFYVKMRRNGVLSDNYTYQFVLKACALMVGMVEGREVHGEIVKSGFGSHVFVVNGLIGMYCKCGESGLARVVFDGSGVKDLVSWNLMVGGYVKCGKMQEAEKLFDEMPEKDVASWSIMIDGYGKKLGDVARARTLFDSMRSRDMLLWNSMISMYTKVGNLVAARQLFDEMQETNVISWSIMIDGYTHHGNAKEALSLFRQMLCQGIKPDKVSVVGAIMACAQLGALDQGRWIHMYMKKQKIATDVVVETALVDMYMKCGSLNEARCLFNCMSRRSIVSWNVIMVGLGMNGFGKEAMKYFALMEMEGLPMDDLIFLGALTACCHAGMISEGLHIFKKMTSLYRIEPKHEHYSCLVDLLGRAGQLDKALEALDSMPIKVSSPLWGSLLLACRIHQNVDLAEVVMERLVELKADDCGVYVLLSNIYSDAGMWEDALRVRKLIKDRKLKKEAGRSIIEVDGDIHEFVSGKKSLVQVEELDLVIWSLSKMQIFTAG